ncbi:MAG TPA: enoyl-CoA hydratase-related protein [Gemmatimonadaceae bacterium]|nr:enoyl-CoA hydratase-related protein [Gemmatimonadaceae bacterium]
MNADKTLLTETRDGIATLTLNRPAVLNAFNRELSGELVAAMHRIQGDDSVRAILLTGSGRAFCAGQDLAEAIPKGDENPDLGAIVKAVYTPVIRAIRTTEKPVVCAVNGIAAGAGAQLALLCDIVVASAAASFVWSFTKIGVIPDTGGTFLLPRMVGLQRASALTMLHDKLTAEQAQAWGLVYKVADPVVDAAREIALKLAQLPTRAMGLTKRGFNHSLGLDLEEAMAFEENLQREAGLSGDYREGVKAFLEKRPPVYTGH